jgi:PLP dependent protein
VGVRPTIARPMNHTTVHSQVAENLRGVEERIDAARRRAGRTELVRIVAVTKTLGPEAVRAAAAAGLWDCGENRVQELEEKRAAVGDLVAWHLIGRLQRNKVKRALPLFELIQSVDSVRLAEALSLEAEGADREVALLVQVNASGEATKGGFDASSAASIVAAVGAIAELPRLRVQGLMTMAPLTDDAGVLRGTFSRTRAAFDACATEVPAFEPLHLSMGMTNDFDIAVEEGSTMLRLGTILFGERRS